MTHRNISGEVAAASHQNVKEREFWLNKLSGIPVKSYFPYDYKSETAKGERRLETVNFMLSRELFLNLKKTSRGNHHILHMILVSAVVLLLGKYSYSRNKDILVGIPIYKQAVEKKFINRAVVLRIQFDTGISFKELLVLVKQTIIEAIENQNYSVEILPEQLQLPVYGDDFPLFDVAVLCDGIHHKKYLEHLHLNMTFSFSPSDEDIEGTLTYNASLYKEITIRRIITQLTGLMKTVFANIDTRLSGTGIITEEEKQQLLFEFNRELPGLPEDKPIHRWFEKIALNRPGDVAVIFEGTRLTYRELNKKSNQLAGLLRKKGMGADHIVGIMVDYSLEMVIAVMAVLKAGAGYLPISPDTPPNRIKTLLRDSNCSLLLTKEEIVKNLSYITLLDIEAMDTPVFVSPTRPQVEDLDALQLPDRSLIDYEKYHPFIGQAMVKNSISIHMSRGCVFNCAYCFKIWPKKYIIRSAENIFNEIRVYYEMGIRRFAFVDDLPNINIEVSAKVFQLIIQKGLKVHLHFPNGIRGDILTKEYIDLMVEAGTITMDLALETTSARLQKLVRKNLNLKRLEENIKYITGKHPHVILELQIIHGIPTETREEARASLDFIKNIKWIHFPYIHILNIYPMSDMARIAIQHGVSQQAIARSADLAYHELPETLPFPGSFTRQYQSEFLNEYFLSKNRLLTVLPYQMKVLTEDELVQKYNSYLPAEINSFSQFLDYVGISRDRLDAAFLPGDYGVVPGLNKKLAAYFSGQRAAPDPGGLRILLLDLSQYFTHDNKIMYDVVEPPLGLMYVMTHLHRTFGSRIIGKIAKSRIDFDSFEQLKSLLLDFKPDVIGIRTLNFYRDFFHRTISLVKQWGIDAPIIAGGPYATSNYPTMLKDKNIDLAVLGEGEITFAEVIAGILENNRELPGEETLKSIPGLAFVEKKNCPRQQRQNREVLFLDKITTALPGECGQNKGYINRPTDLGYIIYTSGSTGTPKGVMIQHNNLVNQIMALRSEFDLDASLHYLLLASFTFDVSIMHIFLPLTTGAKLFLITDETRKDPGKLWQFIEENKITVLNIVPTFMNALLENIENKKIYLKYLFVGGDVFPPELYSGLQETFAVEQIINIYGPTETTINALLYRLPEKPIAETIPIGKPLKNYRVYILDNDLNPMPIGVTGELYISGLGVARGYLNRPELTSDKFLMINDKLKIKNGSGALRLDLNAFSEDLTTEDTLNSPHSTYSTYSTIYKTGDLARWLPDGNVEFAGRIDRQVKIRGFRIELGEIAKHLSKLDHIKEAILTVNRHAEGDRYLSAYIVSEKPIDASHLRNCLSKELPGYMVPSYFVKLDKIPLTVNGKIDFKSLPSPRARTIGKDYVAPRSTVEVRLTEIWANVLGLKKEEIGIDANFFEMGGHSLKATILITRVHKRLNVKIPLVEIFENSTIRKLATYIKSREKETFISINASEKREYYPVSPAQWRLYFLHLMDPQSTAYNMPMAAVLKGHLQTSKMEETFMKLIQRYESLKTSFEMVSAEPVQRIFYHPAFEIEYYDLQMKGALTHGARCKGEEVPEGGTIKNFIRPFDLSRAPLLRVGLIKTSKDEYILMTDMHHTITDGRSLGLLTKDFMTLYKEETLPGLRIQYKDYSQWQGHFKEIIKRQEEYWLKLFAGEIPVLNLPTDFVRPAIQNFDGNTVDFNIGSRETRALTQMAITQGTTLYILLLAVFNVLLSKLSNQGDIVIGTPAAARRHADLEPVIGMFVNTLCMKNQPKEQEFVDFLREVKENTLAAFENQEYPFESVVEKTAVERDISRNPLFDVMFSFLDMESSAIEIPGLKLEPYGFDYKISKFDLTLYTRETHDNLYCRFEYCTKLFQEKTIQRFINYFKKILSSVLEKPIIKLSGIDIISKEEQHQLLYEFNNTRMEYPADKSLHQLFEEQVEKTPDHIALMGQSSNVPGRGTQLEVTRGLAPLFDPVSISYRELSEKSGQLAYLLKEKGVRPDTIVGIMVGRSIEMMIGLLGILKADCAYLPIDPDYPMERIKYMLADSGTQLLVTTGSLTEEGEKVRRLDGKKNIEVIILDFLTLLPFYSSILPSFHLRLPPGVNAPVTSLSYVIYTSGSTGNSKGVAVRHKNAVNFIQGMTALIDFSPGKVIAALTTISFDIFFLETLLAVICGLKVVVAVESQQKDPQLLQRLIMKNRIDMLQVTPSRLKLLLDSTSSRQWLRGIKELMVGGEAFPPGLFKQLNQVFPGKIYNVYGPTETTIWSTVKNLTNSSAGELNIGTPIANTQVYIVNRFLKLQPVGVIGELLIGGDGVALGYLNNPELTAEKFKRAVISHSSLVISSPKKPSKATNDRSQKFLPNDQCPMTNDCSYKFYKTGDLARWLSNGEIEFIGRVDFQVKIRGFRIEPEEIEKQLLRHEQIKEAVVTVRTDDSGEKHLAAYLVQEKAGDVNQLKEYLSLCLPYYMIPSYFVTVDKIPLTPGGKIDRSALPSPEGERPQLRAAYVAPGTETEQILADIWKDVLKLDKVGIYDNFFDLGGNSLNIIQLNRRINDTIKADIPVALLFKYLTISSFVRYLSREETGISQSNQRLDRAEELGKSKTRLKQRLNRRTLRGE